MSDYPIDPPIEPMLAKLSDALQMRGEPQTSRRQMLEALLNGEP